MPGNGICRDPGFKNFLVPPRAPPLGNPEPIAESLRKAVENTEPQMFNSDINPPPPKKNKKTNKHFGTPTFHC